jgi:hypothetical protein
VRLPSQKNKKKEGSEGKREGRREGEKEGRKGGREKEKMRLNEQRKW